MIVNADATNFRSEVLEGDGRVVVQFHAEWCGPCKALGPHFTEAARRFTEVKWVRADVDALDGPTLQAYGIQSIPRLIEFENGLPIRDIKARTVHGIIQEVSSD